MQLDCHFFRFLQIFLCSKVGLYTSPFIMYCLYRRGYLCLDGMMTLTKFSVSLGVILGTSYCLRSYGRCTNPRYKEFLTKLDEVKKLPSERTLVSTFNPSVVHINLHSQYCSNFSLFYFYFLFWPFR